MGPLYSFLKELLGRCHRLKQEIQAVSALPQESGGYRDWALRLLDEVEQRIGHLLRDPDIHVAELAKNYLHDYKRLAEFVHTFEWGPVLVLTRYSERDRLATLYPPRR